MMLFTYQDKLVLKENIEKLTENEWIQIYYILKNNNESITINTNGVFFDLINISNKSLTKIKEMINNKNRKEN
jgi:hypothetical protein